MFYWGTAICAEIGVLHLQKTKLKQLYLSLYKSLSEKNGPKIRSFVNFLSFPEPIYNFLR